MNVTGRKLRCALIPLQRWLRIQSIAGPKLVLRILYGSNLVIAERHSIGADFRSRPGLKLAEARRGTAPGLPHISADL
jgi:hypothetical protein